MASVGAAECPSAVLLVADVPVDGSGRRYTFDAIARCLWRSLSHGARGLAKSYGGGVLAAV